jgi:Ca2+/Na+ antiporter
MPGTRGSLWPPFLIFLVLLGLGLTFIYFCVRARRLEMTRRRLGDMVVVIAAAIALFLFALTPGPAGTVTSGRRPSRWDDQGTVLLGLGFVGAFVYFVIRALSRDEASVTDERPTPPARKTQVTRWALVAIAVAIIALVAFVWLALTAPIRVKGDPRKGRRLSLEPTYFQQAHTPDATRD